ncbi:MAG TPA: low temperature requirement protein A [Micromonosporaceae bacterium]
MSNNDLSLSAKLEPAAPGARPTRLELFYDLVYVYAFLNVTTVTASDFDPITLAGGILVLALLWSAWSAFVAIGNIIRADQGIVPLISFGIVVTVFVTALAMPEAFEDQPPGPPGDVVFALAYFLLRALELTATGYAVRNNPRLRRVWWVVVIPALLATTLLIVAAVLPERIFDGTAEEIARISLWALAIGITYLAGGLIRTRGLSIVSAQHWAERHGHIILIALGESIISLGLGPNLQAGLPITWEVLITAVLGITLIAALWWMYFDARTIQGEEALHRANARERTALARNAYAYLHLLMVAGIILFSLGLKRILARIADPETASLGNQIVNAHLYVLYGGVILYSFALLIFQLLTVRRLDWFQAGGIALLTGLIPIATGLPAISALALLTLSTVVLVVGDSIRNRYARWQLRRTELEERRELEAQETERRSRRLR